MEDQTIPVLGVNIGGMGFLTEVSMEECYRFFEDILEQRGIISVPDFISNAGGVVLGMIDSLGGTVDHVFNAIKTLIGPLTKDILAEARKEKINPRSLAVGKTKEKVMKARAGEDIGIPPGGRRQHLKRLFNIP